ncbi:hypothetical protein [Rhizobium sp. F40D2]|uniref:hypothetical protein n=1 Tax=Rhizobium sp. F40D2 TaxID=3453141 RepID=UPI003F24094E
METSPPPMWFIRTMPDIVRSSTLLQMRIAYSASSMGIGVKWEEHDNGNLGVEADIGTLTCPICPGNQEQRADNIQIKAIS